MIGTRLADDISTGTIFETENEFKKWEVGFTNRHDKAPVRYKTLLENAENAARQIYDVAQRYKSNKIAYQAFVEGLQYGYHTAGGWVKDVKRVQSCPAHTMKTLFGQDVLSGTHEDVVAWKQSLYDEDAADGGKSGYSAGINLKKNVNAVVTNVQELSDYFTVFALEYYTISRETIGDVISDLQDAETTSTTVFPSSELKNTVKGIADRMLLFFKTHTRQEYEAFLRGFNAGYEKGDGRTSSAKRYQDDSPTKVVEKRQRIESLVTDIEDSSYIKHDPREHSYAMMTGQSLGKEFYRLAATEDKHTSLKLLSQYYNENMQNFSRMQRYPIHSKRNTALMSIFSSPNVNLLAPLEEEEFLRVFPRVENTIDSSKYNDVFEMPSFSFEGAGQSIILNKVFASKYGVYSLNQTDASIYKAVALILKNTRGAETVNSLNIATEHIETLDKHLLSHEITPLDDAYAPTSTQRELNTIRACDFFVQSSILLAEQNDRDVLTLIFTPLLANVMASYVQRTTSLNKILKIYPERSPLDPEVKKFLSQYVKELNNRWLERRLKITSSIMFSNTYTTLITDSIASDVAFYLKNKKLESKKALTHKIVVSYDDFDAEDVKTDMSPAEYKEMVDIIGKQRYMRSTTRSLFSWLQLNTEEYWPTDICAIQRVIHDIVMLRHMHEEMNQRATMVENILFFQESTRFTRWDMTNYLAQREKDIEGASEYSQFAGTVTEYVELLMLSPNTDYPETPEWEYSSDLESQPLKFRTSESSTGTIPAVDDDDSSDMDGGTEKYSSRFKKQPVAFRERSGAASSSSDWSDPNSRDVPLRGTTNSDSDTLSSRIGDKFSSTTRTQRENIVLRDITPLDAGLTVDISSKVDLHYIGAYYGHAFGSRLGVAVYSPSEKKIVALETTKGNEKTIGSLLINRVNNLYPNDMISGDVEEEGLSDIVVPEEILHPLVIEATVNYRPNLAGGTHERPHGIYFYLSHSFSPSEPIFVSAADAMNGTRLKLEYMVKYPEIKGHALFNVDSYAKVVDTTTDTCINQSGYAASRIADIAQNKTTKFLLKVPNSDSQLVKGKLILTVHSVSLPISTHSTVKSERELDVDRATSQRIMKEYIDKNRKFYRQHPNIVSSVRNITVFEYAGREGVIPGALFDVFKLAPSKEPYFLQVLGFAIRRRRPDINLAEFNLDDWILFDEKLKVCILMDVARMYVNYCPYLRDMVDNNVSDKAWSYANIELIESFDYIRQRDSGDCEDFSREILQTIMEIKYNLRNSPSKAIQELRRIAEMFVFASILCGVSREAMSLGELSKGNVTLHGHECTAAIPNYIFFEALRRNNPSHPAFKLYSVEEQNAGEGLQIYILEGTGCLFPEPRDKPHRFADIEAEFKKSRAYSDDADYMIFYHPDRDTGFYKQMISILTPELFLKTGYLGFEFLVCQKHNGSMFRGVPFSLLLDIHAHDDIQIIQVPDMSPEVFRAASRVDDDNFPPISFTPGTITQEMKTTCAMLTTGKLRPGQEFFQFQVKFAQMSPAYAQKILTFVKKHKLDVLCVAEPLKLSFSTGDNIGGYMIFIF